ncbi:uncharacterized protein LOC114724289 [Neltuma alba]|uniref:uncharacterized protein LOC114724289 n=1 Tax=Neltuma alba TaxID=207710 RepID=UPI0010A3E65C|nr:uncharacterized protein LOC114724289 [Prosopis alba]XP_028766443.1 uncharacterized protein LOC114724289 [Prosopis alba]
MDSEEEFLMQWLQMRQSLVYLVCLVVQYTLVLMCNNDNEMLALYGNDRASEDDGDIPSNIKKRRRSNSQEFVDTVNEDDQLTSQNEVSLENFSIDMENSSVGGHSLGANSERFKRTKKHSQISLLAEKMDAIATALNEGNRLFKERYTPQISGEETLKLIRDCGCNEEKIPSIYSFLMNDAAKLRTVIQCPPLRRKQVIMDMVFGS